MNASSKANVNATAGQPRRSQGDTDFKALGQKTSTPLLATTGDYAQHERQGKQPAAGRRAKDLISVEPTEPGERRNEQRAEK
jgi:hypothetical protein